MGHGFHNFRALIADRLPFFALDRELELRGTRGNVGEDAGVAEAREPCVVRGSCAELRPGGSIIFSHTASARTAAALKFR
jgi:hypothetical protein